MINWKKDYDFHYDLTGSRNSPLILLLHGFMGNSNDFSDIIPFLSETFCCLAVDLPGHGKTRGKSEACYRMPNTARALINLLDDLNIEKCFLLGYSMGGRLALYMVLHFPSRFEKAILEGASPGLKTAQERSQRVKVDWQRSQELATCNFKDFVYNWYNQSLFKSLQNHPQFEELIEQRLENNPLELAKSLRNLGTGTQPSLWEKLADNHIPLLLLVGESDRKFITINTEIATLCPVAQVQIIENSGHNIHWENPITFVKAVKNFF